MDLYGTCQVEHFNDVISGTAPDPIFHVRKRPKFPCHGGRQAGRWMSSSWLVGYISVVLTCPWFVLI